LEDEGLFIHAIVNREEYRRLIDDVRLRRDRPDLEPQTWLDVTVIGDKTEVSEGAGGIRMVGRMAFLFPANFNRTVQLVRQKLDRLRTLTISDASQAFGQSIDLSDDLFIYVVATLCAGTGSSAFLDMGYLLKRQAEYLNLPVKTVALVTLPPLNTTDTIKLRNTYGSLCELDYFSRDGVTYRAKFPDEPRWLERSDRPYDFVYIVSPD
ncbi:MAG: tubulin-like doman-containing protein, partial [Armatimonadetes bacterium]|nr:tubulin-like doman-containing protein [Armatimonadota bacterium]